MGNDQAASRDNERGGQFAHASTKDTRQRRSWKFWVVTSLVWIGIALGAVLWGVSLWVLRIFGPISIVQLQMNLPIGGLGAGTGVDFILVRSFLIRAVGLPLFLVTLVALVYYFTRRFLKKKSAKHRVLGQRSWVNVALGLLVSSICIIGGGWHLSNTIHLRAYIEGINGTVSMEPYFQDPVVLAAPDDPRNMVLIYLESMDDAFAKKNLSGEDLLVDLKLSTQDWIELEELRQYPASGWTMAGIIGTQCGFPPRPPGGVWAAQVPDANLIGGEESQGSYLSGATCLGDLLEANGYSSVFLGGASADFQSKGNFLLSHGYQRVLDRSHWEEVGETEFSGWGLSDRRLLENAKEELLKLRNGDAPYNLTLLTLDNHVPVYDFGYCEQSSETETHSAIRCQSELVADFVEFMRVEGVLEDTVVVIMADHLMMPNEATTYREGASVVEATQFPLFIRVWSPDDVKLERSNSHQLDIFPTLVELLGFSLENHRAGLGVSLSVDTLDPSQNTILDWELDDLRKIMGSPSRGLYDRLWGISG